MSRSSSKSFSVLSIFFSFSLLSASPTSCSPIKAFSRVNEEFACVKEQGRFSPLAPQLLDSWSLYNVAVVGNLVVAEVVIKMEEIDKTVETIEVDCAGVVLTVVVLG